MRKFLFLFVISVLLCTVPFSGVLAKKKSNPDMLGWGLAFGALYFPQPKFKYESTSIGDISFSCDTYGTTLSLFLLGKTKLYRWKPSGQAELGLCWFREYGHKNMTLQGYPATAESDLHQIGIGFCCKLYYLRIGKIWLSSGFEIYGGWTRDRFNIFLFRDDRKIDVFNPKTRTDFGANGGIVLLSVAIIDNNWDSWDLLFGYGGLDTSRENAYKRYRLEDGFPYTEVDGWYFHIRKLIFFEFHKDQLSKKKL